MVQVAGRIPIRLAGDGQPGEGENGIIFMIDEGIAVEVKGVEEVITDIFVGAYIHPKAEAADIAVDIGFVLVIQIRIP